MQRRLSKVCSRGGFNCTKQPFCHLPCRLKKVCFLLAARHGDIEIVALCVLASKAASHPIARLELRTWLNSEPRPGQALSSIWLARAEVAEAWTAPIGLT
jgi:hypothetical protein